MPYTPSWPERVRVLAAEIRRRRTPEEARSERAELWVLVHSALLAAIWAYSRQSGPVDREVVRDVAAEKALEIFTKFDRGEWEPEHASAAQTFSFVRVLARNGLIDTFRKEGRTLQIPESREPVLESIAGGPPPPDTAGFVAALEDCLGELTERVRKMWFLRAFHELPSKEIARHPDVNSTPAAVDMALSRARAELGPCVRGKGYDETDLKPGVFSAIWEALHFRSQAQSKVPTRDEPHE